MPMIDVYSAPGTFADKHALAAKLAGTPAPAYTFLHGRRSPLSSTALRREAARVVTQDGRGGPKG